jgi:hypothetical protein
VEICCDESPNLFAASIWENCLELSRERLKLPAISEEFPVGSENPELFAWFGDAILGDGES